MAPLAVVAETVTQATQTEIATQLSTLKIRITLILGTGLLFILLLSIVWVRMAARQIHRPVHIIHRAVLRMAQGRLNETVSVDGIDEFGQIGASINELAANLQELLLYVWKQSGQCLATLQDIQRLIESADAQPMGPELRESLHQLTTAVESMRFMAKAYVFYDVRLEGDQALAANRLVTKEPPPASAAN